jgi:iron complex outermembrane receptor protein
MATDFAKSKLARLQFDSPQDADRKGGNRMTISSAIYLRLGTSALAACLVLPAAAHAQDRSVAMTIPAQDLGSALKAIAAASGEQIIFRGEVVRGKRSNAVQGSYSAERAIAIAIEGKGLSITRSPRGIIMVVTRTASLASTAASDEPSDEPIPVVEEIIVTGSRIRGAPSASPVITQTKEQIRLSGVADLGEFARTLPQSFGGGQNPGVIVGASGAGNENVSSASSINLRGLGADATLTLLNGRRLAYNGAGQAVDISAIPLSALDRIEVVADGASAIYGSDAVAGVANIILKKSYDGVEVSTRQAKATEGGFYQQQYSILVGAEADNAGFLAAYSYDSNTQVTAGQRRVTDATFDSYTLYPALRHHNLLATGFWSPSEAVTISTDLLFSSRKSLTYQPLLSNDYLDQGYVRSPRNRSFTVSPKLEIELAPQWEATLLATVAEDKVSINSELYFGGAFNFASVGTYTNRSNIFEANVEGTLASLAAGDLKLAAGGGYRRNRLIADLSARRPAGTTPTLQFSEDRSSYYAFGELAVPLVAPAMDVPFVHSLSLSAAARYESYSGGMGDVVTPKLGMVWGPSADFDLKFSWGRSYKTPTLYQQFLDYTAQLLPMSNVGATGYPAQAGVLFISGGNSELKPERAETIAASVDLHPRAVPGLKLELSAFRIRYKNRIAEPVTALAGALTNPAYQSAIYFSPTAADIDRLAAGAPNGLVNLTAYPYDPANVVAIIDARFANVAAQTVKGIDANLAYSFTVGGGTIDLSAGVAYLDSSRQLTPEAAVADTAGLVFFPPNWRGRAGASWTSGGFTAAIFGNYVGGVEDRRRVPTVKVEGMTTADLSLRYRTEPGAGILGGMEIGLSVQNLFNGKPDRIYSPAAFLPAYDSTNYSILGRVASFTLVKAFR